MKTAMSLCLSVAFAVALSAQTKSGNPASTKPKQPLGTRIGSHRLGETFNEWLAVEKIDLDAVCKSGTRSDPMPQNASEDDLQKYFTDQYQSQEDSRTCDDLRPIRDAGGNGEYGDRRGLGATPKDPETWTFTNGKLVRNQAVYDADIATRELGFLKEAYGPPTLVNKLPRQNLFGAHWNDVMLTWHLAGGTTLYMLAASDNVVVTFLSREYKKIPAHEPNPYLSDKP
jgi:hypothetical protein